MVTQILFVGIVLALAAQRLFELRLSRRNEARILAQGGRKHAPEQFAAMKLLHATWFLAMVVEVVWLDRPFVLLLSLGALIVLAIGQSLRYAAMRALGWRWTVRIMTLPDRPPITHGIYRYLRHPNYLGVILEIASVPLLHTAVFTALFFSVANACLLAIRIRAEEKALSMHNDYVRAFGDRSRLIPRPARPDTSNKPT